MNQLLHTPDGVRDIYGQEYERYHQLNNTLIDCMKRYGYQGIQTPSFEYFDIFSAERGTVAAKDMYKFFDRDGNTLVLRPDLTPAIARCVAKYYKEEEAPIRLCYSGSTYINESDYQGKLKEFTQIGAELINEPSPMADAEMIALTVECMLSAGLREFQVEVGEAGFFRALVEEACLDKEETELLRAAIIEKNSFGLKDILSKKEMNDSTRQALIQMPQLFGNVSILKRVQTITDNPKARETIDRLWQLYDCMKAYGYENYLTFDLGALSKYHYYTGITFCSYTYGTGNPIITGGRYNSLVGQFGKSAPAIGFGLCLDELLAALLRQGIAKVEEKPCETIFYRQEEYEEAVKKAQSL